MTRSFSLYTIKDPTLVIEEDFPPVPTACEDEEAKQLCQSSAEDIETEIHLKSCCAHFPNYVSALHLISIMTLL